MDRHKRYVFTVAFRILNQREEAEEAAQDAFVKALSALETFNRDAKFSTWLYRITCNAALARRRKKRLTTQSIDDPQFYHLPDEGGPAEWQQAERRKFVQQALQQLPPDDVMVLTLFYFQERSLEEMAETTGIVENTLKIKLFRARKRFAKELNLLLKEETKELL